MNGDGAVGEFLFEIQIRSCPGIARNSTKGGSDHNTHYTAPTAHMQDRSRSANRSTTDLLFTTLSTLVFLDLLLAEPDLERTDFISDLISTPIAVLSLRSIRNIY